MIPRLYCAGELRIGAGFDLPAGPAHHARDVLRLTAGDALTLLNGLGGEYRARIVDLSKQRVNVDIEAFDLRESESPFLITVAQCLASGEKMDWIVEKAVELGAVAVQPLAAERSILRLSPERALKRLAHWRAIAVAACEQCGRNRIPEIHAVAALHPWVASRAGIRGIRLMLSPVHRHPFSALPQPPRGMPVTLLVGPEAGLSDGEEKAAQAAGFQPVLFGPRVMRTETAALAALAAIHARWGDY